MRQLLIVRLKNVKYLSTPISNKTHTKIEIEIETEYDKRINGIKDDYKSSYLRMYNCLPIKIDKQDKDTDKEKTK
jgi:hypothetical protein